MGGDSFTFQQFDIKQTRSAMKVGTDGIIVGAWAKPQATATKVLDIGAGTGLIALMLAQRFQSTQIEAIEIDADAAAEAKENFSRSLFSSRLRLINADFKEFSRDCDTQYDLVVSNPPYFDGSYKSTDTQRTAARHRDSLPFEELIEGVLRVLTPTIGRFVVILPAKDAEYFIDLATSKDLVCTRQLRVRSRASKEIKRVVAQFSISATETLKIDSLTIMDNENNYTEEFKELTKEFYLRF